MARFVATAKVLALWTRCGAAGQKCLIAVMAILLLSKVATTSAQTIPVFTVEVIHSGAPLELVTGMVCGSEQNLYVSNNPGQLVEFDLTHHTNDIRISGLPLSSPGKMVLGDGSAFFGNDLFLADHNSEVTGSCCNGRVFRINRATFAASVLSVGNPLYAPGDPAALSFGGLGVGSGLYVLDFQGASVQAPLLFVIRDDGSREVLRGILAFGQMTPFQSMWYSTGAEVSEVLF
jgi:hypothetical protein